MDSKVICRGHLAEHRAERVPLDGAAFQNGGGPTVKIAERYCSERNVMRNLRTIAAVWWKLLRRLFLAAASFDAGATAPVSRCSCS